MVPRLHGHLPRPLRRHQPARLAAQDPADRRRRDRQGTFHQSGRHPQLPQGDRHRRGARKNTLPRRRPAGQAGQNPQQHLPRGRRLQRRRPAAQFDGLHPADDRPADLQGQRSGRGQRDHHRTRTRHRRADGGVRTAHPQTAGRRTPLRSRRPERPVDTQHDGAVQEHDDRLRRHQPLRMDHRSGHPAGGHRRREQHHAGDRHGAHLRIRHPQGAGRQTRVDHPPDPDRIGDDNGHVRLYRHGAGRCRHGGGQLCHQPDAGRDRKLRRQHLPQSDARSGRGRQRHGRTGHCGPDRRIRPRLPGRTTENDRRPALYKEP